MEAIERGAAARIQAVHRGWRRRREHAGQEAAALCIQAAQRGGQGRRRAKTAKQAVAAVRIQAVHRGRLGRLMAMREARVHRDR